MPLKVFHWMLPLLVALLLKSERVVSDPVEILESNTTTSCGFIDFKGTLGKLEITESHKFSLPEFETFYKNLSTSSSIQVWKENCFIEICGHPTILQKGKRVILPKCERFTNYNSTDSLPFDPYGLDYEATSILCGCKQDRPDCQNDTCERRSHFGFVNDPTTCAVLYQDRDCKECVFDGVKLSHNGTFNTGPNAVIRSIYVQPECVLYETAFGYSEYDPPEFPTQFFVPYTLTHNSSTNIRPSYTRRGEDFFCTCPKLDKHLFSISPSEEPWVKVGLGIGGISIVAVVAAIAFKRQFSKQQELLPKDFITKHINGTNKEDEIRKQIMKSNLAPGVKQAVSSPFDKKFEIPRENIFIDTETVLGKGTFGIVYKGTVKWKSDNHKSRKQEVAIKTVKPYTEDGYKKSMLNEVKVLAYLGEHPNILRLVGACISNIDDDDGGEVYIVLQLCVNGSLKKFLESLKKSLAQQQQTSSSTLRLQPNAQHPDYLDYGPVLLEEKPKPPELCQSWLNQFFKWSQEIANGMEFLAQKGVLHVDLGARNILLTEDLVTKIGDFGLSRKLYDKMNYFKHGREPVPKVNALESLAQNNYSVKSDVWAYGVTLWEIFSLADDPYTDLGYGEIIDFLSSGQRLPCPPYATMEIYKNSMIRCWDKDLEERPSFSELKTYFENILKNYEHEVREND